ncbi:MAG TPA: hypothetical protein VEC02_01170 [Nitrososphaerales archaeon]|nr:hypothetical protein [Nitrososphaerales archaeon]
MWHWDGHVISCADALDAPEADAIPSERFDRKPESERTASVQGGTGVKPHRRFHFEQTIIGITSIDGFERLEYAFRDVKFAAQC